MILLNIAKCTNGALTEATAFRSYHKLIKCSFRILTNLPPQKIHKLGNIQLKIDILYVSYFELPLFGSLVAIVDGGLKTKAARTNFMCLIPSSLVLGRRFD